MKYFIIHSINGFLYPIKIETDDILSEEKILKFKINENDKIFNDEILSMKDVDFIESVDENQYLENL